jgi:HNH endonuclease
MSIPFGTCHCACGGKTRIASRNDYRDGSIKGKPVRYIRGHHRRKSFIEYKREDRGYKTLCWIWQKGLSAGDRGGYGTIFDSGKMRKAHVVYWERENGPVPEGYELDHLCQQRPCVNPEHTEPVIDAINTQRGKVAKLNADDVQAIRRNVMGHEKHQLATIYGVSVSNIKMIVAGKTWKNIA